MAILPMKHIEIIAMQEDAKKIVELLQRLGTVDVTERYDEDVTDELAKKGELFSTEESGEDSSFFAETPEKEKQVTANKDICPCCGYRPVTGRFCPECGSLVKK